MAHTPTEPAPQGPADAAAQALCDLRPQRRRPRLAQMSDSICVCAERAREFPTLLLVCGEALLECAHVLCVLREAGARDVFATVLHSSINRNRLALCQLPE